MHVCDWLWADTLSAFSHLYFIYSIQCIIGDLISTVIISNYVYYCMQDIYWTDTVNNLIYTVLTRLYELIPGNKVACMMTNTMSFELGCKHNGSNLAHFCCRWDIMVNDFLIILTLPCNIRMIGFLTEIKIHLLVPHTSINENMKDKSFPDFGRIS